jgi:hypothetical protein
VAAPPPEEALRALYYYGLQGERQERGSGRLYGNVRTNSNLVQVKWRARDRTQDCGLNWIHGRSVRRFQTRPVVREVERSQESVDTRERANSFIEELARSGKTVCPWWCRHDPQRFQRGARAVGCPQRPRREVGLRHDDGIGEGHKHAVSHEKGSGPGRVRRCEGPHHGAGTPADRIEQARVLRRKTVLASGARNRPSTARRIESPAMRGCVDPHRAAGYDDGARADERPGQEAREVLGVGARLS